MKTNSDENTSLIRERLGGALEVASTSSLLYYRLLLASRAMTDLEARLTTIEEFAGVAGSSSRDIGGIKSAETEGEGRPC